MSFMTRTRDQIFEKTLKDATFGPPVGSYRTQYCAMDPKITSPVYGTKEVWGGKLAKQSKKIKEEGFRNCVSKCERINRTLVYKRKEKKDEEGIEIAPIIVGHLSNSNRS